MSRKFLCFDCNTGIAGDMTVAALVGVGVPEDVLKNALYNLNIEGLSVIFNAIVTYGFAA